jgi:beta-lactamase regulating signal transducer with metallopeptidase domain
MILLPASAISGLSTSQIELILAHELAHVRRHDWLVNFAQIVIEALLFYHPAMWWVSNQIRKERENCCDDMAVAISDDRRT